jgi:gamma-glutamyltranspeptidase/glutathione hydrolase
MTSRGAKEGAVVAGHPLATAAGLDVLARGGKAMDAAIAMAAVLAVVRPHMCGLGGDAFALYFEADTGKVTALNGSGRAGSLATPEFFAAGARRRSRALHVTVPGVVRAYADAHARFGSLPFPELLSPAINLAREGFPVSELLSREFEKGRGTLPLGGETPYFPGDRTPQPGSLLRNLALSETLESIAALGPESFYQGPPAETLSSFLRDRGGHLFPEDFASHESTWTEPLWASHFDLDFWVLPPNSQGLAFLQQMGMALGAGIPDLAPGSAEYVHRLVEIKKLAFADRDRWIADPSFYHQPTDRLLDPEYLEERLDLLRPDRAVSAFPPGFGGAALEPAPVRASGGDTVFLTAVDGEGNGVSWIQSIFSPFGSGLFEPTTGVLFHNRGASFSLQEGHPNQIAPRKRPFHTLSPLVATREGKLAFTLGTPGADGQTQTLLQVVLNHLVFRLSPHDAVDAPRFRSFAGLDLAVEGRFSEATRDGLAKRGHEVRTLEPWASTMGGAQMIRVDADSGELTAAADPRREARAAVL